MSLEEDCKILTYLVSIEGNHDKIENLINSSDYLFQPGCINSYHYHKVFKRMLPEYYSLISRLIVEIYTRSRFRVTDWMYYNEYTFEMMDSGLFFVIFMKAIGIENLNAEGYSFYSHFRSASWLSKYLKEYENIEPGYINTKFKENYLSLTTGQRRDLLMLLMTGYSPLDLLKIILSFGYENDFLTLLAERTDVFSTSNRPQHAYYIAYINFYDHLHKVTTSVDKTKKIRKLFLQLLFSSTDDYTTMIMERINQHGGLNLALIVKGIVTCYTDGWMLTINIDDLFERVFYKPVLLSHVIHLFVNDKKCYKLAKEMIKFKTTCEKSKRILVKEFNINTSPAREIKQKQEDELELCNRLNLADDLVTVIKTLL